MSNPGRHRRDGRNAFLPNEDPADYYEGSDRNFCHFCDGWEEMKKECSCDGLKEDNNWQIDQLKKEIMYLGYDARLHSVLFDILDLIQGIKNEK